MEAAFENSKNKMKNYSAENEKKLVDIRKKLVEEEETKCEGMIRMRDLSKDYYIFDKRYMRLTGKRTHKKYGLGDRVKFRVSKVDMNKKTIDYILI